MTKYHEWKRRLWGGDYPIENGPPFQDPDGNPVWPGLNTGPLNGLDDDGVVSGNPVVLTFSGTLTADTRVFVVIIDETASAPPGGRFVGANIVAPSGSTAAQVGDLVAQDFNARNWSGWISAVNAAGVVTFTPVAAGTAFGEAYYKTDDGSGTVGAPAPMPISELRLDTSILPEGGAPAGATAEVEFRGNGVQYSTTNVAADGPKAETMEALKAELIQKAPINDVQYDMNSMLLIANPGFVLSDGLFFVEPPTGG